MVGFTEATLGKLGTSEDVLGIATSFGAVFGKAFYSGISNCRSCGKKIEITENSAIVWKYSRLRESLGSNEGRQLLQISLHKQFRYVMWSRVGCCAAAFADLLTVVCFEGAHDCLIK